MPYKVIHLAATPTAGAPQRIVKALNSYTDYEARLISLKREGPFEHDIIFSEQKALSVELIESAAIIHLHNYLSLDSNDFSPIDFHKLQQQGKRFIRHFHSQPGFVSRVTGESVESIVNCPIPQLVAAQHMERFYPNAFVVPNIIHQDEEIYESKGDEPEYDVAFTPSNSVPAWSTRWDTKGTPETLAILTSLEKEKGLTYKCLQNKTFNEVMQAKCMARIIIDELVTGGYHLSGLEGLSLGKPVLAYLDERTQHVLRFVSQSDQNPFISVRLEEARNVLSLLIEERDLCQRVGEKSRDWVSQYWNDKQLVNFYVDAYQNVFDNPESICRQKELSLNGENEKFFAVTLPDEIYSARKKGFLARCPLSIRLREWFVRFAGKCFDFFKALD